MQGIAVFSSKAVSRNRASNVCSLSCVSMGALKKSQALLRIQIFLFISYDVLQRDLIS